MYHEARIATDLSSPAAAATVYHAIEPEAADLSNDRSSTTVTATDATVTIGINAADLIALRAAVNTWCGLLEVAERVEGVVGSNDRCGRIIGVPHVTSHG